MSKLQELYKKHGTPAEFARAVYSAIGEISVAEAEAAIAKYEKEWDEAEAIDREVSA